MDENATRSELLYRDYFGNGQPGFRATVTEALASINGKLAHMEGAWDALKRFGAIILGLVAIITLILAWLTYRDSQRKPQSMAPQVVIQSAPPQLYS